jgi:23S rRNA A2030 N6-methylase RlmJ
VVFLNAEKQVVRELRKQGWHTGYSRNENDLDRGLAWIYTDCESDKREYELKKWVRAVSAETEVITNGITVIWYPTADLQTVKQAINNVVEINATTATDAIEQLRQSI